MLTVSEATAYRQREMVATQLATFIARNAVTMSLVKMWLWDSRLTT